MGVYSGSCLCTQVKFECQGTFNAFYLCHCTYCQKDTGSAHGANLFSANMQLIWNQGHEQVKIFRLPSTRHAKSFCGNCGSALPWEVPGDGGIVLPAGSLDSALDIKPSAHIFCDSQAPWETELPNLPKFPKFP